MADVAKTGAIQPGEPRDVRYKFGAAKQPLAKRESFRRYRSLKPEHRWYGLEQ